jgi:hypothetical protein
MSTISWKLNINGTWSNAADWSGGVLPGAGSDVVLDTRSFHTITFASTAGSTTIHSLTADTDLLSVTGGTLTILAGAVFDQGLTLTGGELALQGTTASVAGTFTDTAGYVSLGTATTLSLSGPGSFGDTAGDVAALDGGTLATGGTTTLLADGNQYYSSLLLGGGATWVNSGVVDAAGYVAAGDGAGPTATLTNLAGAQFNLTTDTSGIEGGGYYNQGGGIQYGTSTFSNAGTFAKTGGSNTSTIASVFTNTGVINAATGNIEFDGGGIFGGTLTGAGSISFGASSNSTLSAGAVVNVANLSVYSAELTLAGALSDTGAVSIYNNATLALAAGASTITGGFYLGNSGALDLDGGTLTVANGNFGDYSATLSGPGTLALTGTTTVGNQAGYQFDIQAGATVTNTGTLDLQENLYFQDQYGAGNSIVNQAGNVIETGGYSISAQQDGTDTLINAGLVEDSPSTNVSITFVAPFVVSTGTILADAGGTIEFDGGGTFSGTLAGAGQINFGGGSSTLAAGSVLSVANLGFDGGVLTLGSDLAYAGNVFLDSGELVLAAGANTVTGTFEQSNGTLALNGGTLSLTNANLNDYYYVQGALTGPGTLALAGTTTLGAGQGYSYYIWGGATVTNSGTVDMNQNIYFQDQSGAGNTITNLAGASFNYLGDFSVSSQTAGADTFINVGTYTKTGGTGTSDIGAAFVNTGVISVSSGVLDFSGGGTFAGTITGAGTIDFDNGTSTLSSIAVFNAAGLLLDGGTLLLEANENFRSAQYSENYGAFDLNGYNASVQNANLQYYGTLTGTGTLSLYGTTTFGNGQGYTYYIDGGATLLNAGVFDFNQNLQFYDPYGTSSVSAGTLANAAGGTINLQDTWSISTSQAPGNINNAGLFELTGGGGDANISAYFTSTGTVSSAVGTIALQGGGSFAGTLTGASEIDFDSNTYTFGPLTSNTADTYLYGATLLLNGNTTFSGPVQAQFVSLSLNASTSQTLTISGSLTVNPQNYYYGGDMYVGGGSTLLTTGNTTINSPSNYSGYWDFAVGGNSTWSNSGTVSQSGFMYLGDVNVQGGGTLTNQAKGVFDLTSDNGTIGQGYYYNTYGTQISNNAFITNAGKFEKTGGTLTSTVSGTFTNTSTGTFGSTTGTLALEDGGSLSGLISDGSHVQLYGNFALSAFTIGGSVVANYGNISATGALTLGDTKATTFQNYGTYTLQGGAGITASTAATSYFYNYALLETVTPAGHSVISSNVANTGTILAGAGTLTLAGTLTGGGALQIGAGATLELGAAASGIAEIASFLTSTGTLALDSVATVKEHINGFVVGDTIDLVNTAATSATLNASNGLVISNGSSVLATLTLAGTHTGDVYSVGSDGHGGSAITITSNTTAWKGGNIDWNTAGAWTNGAPGIGSNATVGGTTAGTLSLASGETAFANTLALTDTKATEAIAGIVTIAKTLTQSAGTLNFSGEIIGGTLVLAGGTDNWSEGPTGLASLVNVVEEGNITIATANAGLGLVGSTVLSGPSGTGTATVKITGSDSELYVQGVNTLNNATIDIGSAATDGGGFGGFAALESYDADGQGGVLTLGPQLTIVQTGLYAEIFDDGAYGTDPAAAYDGIFNSGKITAAVQGGTFTFAGTQFENDGTIAVSNGDDLNLNSASFINTGSLSVSGGTFTIGAGYFENDGSITTTNTAFVLNGTLTTAQLLAMYGTGDSIAAFNGYLNNTGATLTLGTGTALGSIPTTGFIEGGTIVDPGTGLSFEPTAASTILSDVSYQGTMNITGASANTSIVGTFAASGLGGTGEGTINITGSNATLFVDDTRTLNNEAITLGSAGGDVLYVSDYAGTNATLTLGAQTTINAAAGIADLVMVNPTDAMINDGTINATSAGTTLNIGLGNTGTFTNAGTIAVSNGNTLNISATTFTSTGPVTLNNATANIASYLTTASLDTFVPTNNSTLNISGTLDNTGNTLTIGTGTALGTLNFSGALENGIINDAGGGLNLVSNGGETVFNGVTYEGTLNLAQPTINLDIYNGITLTGASGAGTATVNITGANDRMGFYTSTTLNNATINMGGTAPGFYAIDVDDPGETGVTLTLGSNLLVQETVANGYADLGDRYGVPTGVLINDGKIDVAASGATFDIGDANFTNAGTVLASAGGTLFIQPEYSFTNLTGSTGTTLTGGTYEADAKSAIILANNTTFTTLNATITLSGTGSTIESLNTATNSYTTVDNRLSTIGTAGVLNLVGGRNLTANINFTDNGLLNLGGTTFTENALTIGATGIARGAGSIAAAITDNGIVNAVGGTLTLTKAVTGTGTLQIASGANLTLATTDTASGGVSFTGAGSALTLNTAGGLLAKINGLVGNSLVLPNATIASASISGTLLTLNLGSAGSVSYTLTSAIAQNKLAISSNGHTLTAYGNAVASGHTPEPVAFGNQHLGGTFTQFLSVGNAAPVGAYENLDASLGGASTGITATGSFSGLAPGQSNSNTLKISVTSATAGTIAGTATLSLSTDGTGLDSAGTTSLGSQTVTVTGAFYAYAAPKFSATTLNFGATRVGGTLAGQTLILANGTTASAYQESLIYALNPSGAFSSSTTGGTIASGSNTLATLSLSSATAGNFNATMLSVGLTSTGAGTSGLGTTTLAGQNVTLNGQVYATAVAQLSTTTLNFGVVHVGDPAGAATQTLTIQNAATGALADSLIGGLAGFTGGGFSSTSGSLSLTEGATGALSIALATSTSGVFSGSAALTLSSHDSVLADLALSAGPITLQGSVDNYAVAALDELSGGGSLAQSGAVTTLDLGQIALGASPVSVALEALNAATGTADALGGTLTAAGSSAFTNSGLGTFAGLGAGQADTAPLITLATSAAGTFTETVTMTSAGSNASGYSGTLTTQTFSITGTIVGPETFTLPSTAATFTGGPANDIFIATAANLLPADSLNGAGGTNTLTLSGGGTFAINALTLFENIGVIAASEGQAVSGTHAATNQVVDLPGSTETVKVAAGKAASGNSNPEIITINAGSASGTINLSTGYDTVNLGTGSETVELGSVHNTVTGGAGIGLVQATAALATAAISGSTTTGPLTTTLEITTAGTLSLNAADTYLTVKLDAATRLNTDKLSFITVNASNGGDTVVALGTSQTLIAGTGDILYGDTSGSTNFIGASTGLNGDTLADWATGDVIDLTNINAATLQALTYTGGKLGVSDGTHSATFTVSGVGTALALHNFSIGGSDGNGGTLIDYHS